MSGRFEKVVAAIDAANDADPTELSVNGAMRPAETLYGERMSAWLARLIPDAGELLRIAVRAQHLERFKLPRADYPQGKPGYYRWRNEQKRRHAMRIAEIMRDAGYTDAEAERVSAIVRKENLAADAEVQLLEDCACLVFMEFYFADFATQHPADKIIDIVAKSWKKMSAKARSEAMKLPLPEDLAPLVHAAITQHEMQNPDA